MERPLFEDRAEYLKGATIQDLMGTKYERILTSIDNSSYWIGFVRGLWNENIDGAKRQKSQEMVKIGQVKEPPNKVLPEDKGHIFDGVLGTKDQATGTTPEITGTTHQVTGTAENILPQNIMNVKNTQNLVNYKQNMSNLFNKNINSFIDSKKNASNNMFNQNNLSSNLAYDPDANILFTF